MFAIVHGREPGRAVIGCPVAFFTGLVYDSAQWRAVSLSGFGKPVNHQFFEQSTERVARALLNLVLVHETDEGVMAGRIVECEMYQGPEDRGAHSYGGVPTPRTEIMYGPPGHAYVFLIYGMYDCLNVVTAPEGTPHAILIRALEPIEGLALMEARGRPTKHPKPPIRVAAGPGKLCRALGITRVFNGHPLDKPPLYLAEPTHPWPSYHVEVGARINIDYAGDAAHYPWRFWIAGHPSVSL